MPSPGRPSTWRSTGRSPIIERMAVIDVTEQDFEQEVIERSHDDARRRRLLGRVVRPVPRSSGRCSRRPPPRARARSCWPSSTPTPTRRSRRPSASRASPPSRRSRTAASSTSSSAPSRRPASSASSTRSCPARPTRWWPSGDEASLRRALELEPGRADAAVPLARLLHRRGEPDEALSAARQRHAAPSPPTAWRARIAPRAGRRRSTSPRPSRPSTTATPSAPSTCSSTRCPRPTATRTTCAAWSWAILDELGVDHPLARDARRRAGRRAVLARARTCARTSAALRSGCSHQNMCPTPSSSSRRASGIARAMQLAVDDRQHAVLGAVDDERRRGDRRQARDRVVGHAPPASGSMITGTATGAPWPSPRTAPSCPSVGHVRARQVDREARAQRALAVA